MDRDIVNPQESTVANADLWSKYFQDEWSRWAAPFGGSQSPIAAIAEGTAAQVAGFVTLVAAAPIAWLFASNAPQVSEITGDDRSARERPLQLPREEAPQASPAPEDTAA